MWNIREEIDSWIKSYVEEDTGHLGLVLYMLFRKWIKKALIVGMIIGFAFTLIMILWLR